MSAGDLTCPIVFRGINGVSAGVGAQHSQCFAAWYSSCPGLKVVMPYNVEDTRGLTKAAIRDNDPVVILENEMMYGQTFQVDDRVMDKDFLLPIGKAKVEREGSDITLVAISKMVGFSLQAAEILEKEDGIKAEVLNLRSIRPLDRDAIIQSVKKTNRVVSVEEGWPQCGIGSEVAAVIMESEAFDYLDAPLNRVTGADVPMPYSVSIEKLAVPQVENVVSAVRRTCYGLKK